MTKHESEGRTKGTDGKAPTSVKKATRKKGNYKPGPGRPPGSKVDETGLTPNQKGIARKMLEAELESDQRSPENIIAQVMDILFLIARIFL